MAVQLSVPASGADLPAFDPGRLRARAEALLVALDRPEAELSVSLVEDAEIAEMNEQYRGRSGPTDVLSFSLLEGEFAEHNRGMLGDVIVGLGVADRQATELGHSLDEELLRLLIHGALHLLGHDHEEDAEAEVMEAQERDLFSKLAK